MKVQQEGEGVNARGFCSVRLRVFVLLVTRDRHVVVGVFRDTIQDEVHYYHDISLRRAHIDRLGVPSETILSTLQSPNGLNAYLYAF
jgi:hypothetical protein